MNKKNVAPYISYAVMLLCIAAILGMGYRSLSAYKGSNAGLIQTIEEQKKNIEQQNKVIDQQNKVIVQQNKNIEQLNKNVAQLVTERNNAITSCVPAAPEMTDEQKEVKDILEPDVAPTDDDSTQIDALKKRYEEMLVTYFVLKKCEKVKVTDYHVIISALSQEMASLEAPGRLQADILTSAQGSYQELYSNSPCDEETVEPLQAQYKIFIDAVAEQFTPR
jgi:uncharacterized coiled-coil protein SlyX